MRNWNRWPRASSTISDVVAAGRPLVSRGNWSVGALILSLPIGDGPRSPRSRLRRALSGLLAKLSADRSPAQRLQSDGAPAGAAPGRPSRASARRIGDEGL